MASGTGPMTVAGRYRLVEVIGTGGMGRVWRAYDELLDREVAVKEHAGDERLSIEREARAAARLDHPAVVRVFDVVRTTGRSWIVMEYVPSRSLHDVVTGDDGLLSHREAARVGLALLDALQTAHRAGVLHLDVKPRNVLITPGGRVVLTDFGLATVGRSGPGAQLVGSPNYIAPERLDGHAADARTDLWSLGATLYTAVEGHPPFGRPSVTASLAAVRTDAPDEPRRPGPLHPVIAGLLVKDPAARATAADTRTALHLLAHRTVGVAPVPAPARVRPWKKIIGGLALAAVAVTFAVRGVQRTEASPGPAPAPSVSTAAAQVVTSTAKAPISLPEGWLWQVDPAGFRLPVPRGWVRVVDGPTVRFSNGDGTSSFAVRRVRDAPDDPLGYWQAAERAALQTGALPAYRKVSMGVLLVTGGGADWEFSWQPPDGPRLHSHRLLLPGHELAWTTRDQDWTISLGVQRTFLDGFRDPSATASPWAVPAPASPRRTP
ncbi:protein kinase [Actinoplanes sp. NPDC051494]|uniref:protein kinase domain-containing protein n=1 Tax=Actinoplanes sp. NPDC051494 TaxID=3363907 RepID=UPI003788B641